MITPHRITADNATRIKTWFAERGGIAVWPSVNLSNPGASWTTPAYDPHGNTTTKPTWEAASTPSRIITDPAEVVVDVPKLVKRFHIGVRRGAQGFMLKVTDRGTRRIHREVEKAGEHAWYAFDYCTQEALIFVPGETVALTEWKEQ